MSEVSLTGKIIGFEEQAHYALRNLVAEDSPFRILESTEGGFSFVVVNPYDVTDNYAFEVQDAVLVDLDLNPKSVEDLAVLCIIRHDDENVYVNLRSPLVFNTKKGLFRQIILDNETYSVSTPFRTKAQ